jgi:hypothetical protein
MLNTEHLSSNKLIKHVDNIKSLVIENELLKYIIKSLKKRLESDKKLEIETQQSLHTQRYDNNNKQKLPDFLSSPYKYDKQQKQPYFESNPYKYEIKRNSKPKLLIILRKKNII